MAWVIVGALVVSGLLPFLIVRGRARRPAAWAAGGLLVYLVVWSAMRLTIEAASGRELYGLDALARAKVEGAIKQDVYERERTRTMRAFGASILAAIAASAGYGFIVRISSRPKSA